MIQVHKSQEPPKSLSGTGRYDGEDVRRQLISDQREKCYLCESVTGTDFVIDHFHSQRNCLDQVSDWRNLLLTCSYCNMKKGARFDTLLDPTSTPIEERIEQRIDYSHKRASFTSSHHDPETESTMDLLSRIFNGSGKIRSVREERFFEKFISEMNLFTSAVNHFLDTRSEKYRSIVSQYLDAGEEYLGFKYWIIRSSDILSEEFQDECRWNR